MATWEYRQSREFGELEALGRAGWEVVAVLPSPQAGEAIFYLKRAGPGFRERVTLEQKQRYARRSGIRAPMEQESR